MSKSPFLRIASHINEMMLKTAFNSTTQSRLLTILKKEPFENTVAKEKNTGKQHLLYFQQHFLSYLQQILPFGSLLVCCLQMLSLVTTGQILYLHQTSSVLRKSPLELHSVLLE